MKKYGFYLNGTELIKTVTCGNIKAAKAKLNFMFPVNFNIQVKELK